MYSTRQLGVSDRSSFRELRQTALTLNPDEFLMTADEESAIPRLVIEGALECPDERSFFIGAFAAPPEALVGMAGLITGNLRKVRHAGHVTSLFVHPAHRRAGIARTLVEQLLTRAHSAGLEVLRLEVVSSNRAAIALYESLGFVRYGCEPAAYRAGERAWDLLLMTRSL